MESNARTVSIITFPIIFLSCNLLLHIINIDILNKPVSIHIWSCANVCLSWHIYIEVFGSRSLFVRNVLFWVSNLSSFVSPVYICTFFFHNLFVFFSVSLIYYLDINECDNDMSGCHVYADCINTAGSYYCTCKAGSTGDGRKCSGVLFKSQHCNITPHFFSWFGWLVGFLKLPVFSMLVYLGQGNSFLVFSLYFRFYELRNTAIYN